MPATDFDNIYIDGEFSARIKPLSEEERNQLEANIVEHGGARDPLVVWPDEEWQPEDEDEPLAYDDGENQDSYEFGSDRLWSTETGTYWMSDWPCVLLDGHNRYEICIRLGLPYQVEVMRFGSRDEAADWIDRNQLGRRNLDSHHMSLLRGRRYNRTKNSHGGEREASGQNVHLKTAESLAAEHGVDERTIRRDGDFAEAVETLGIEREIVTGEIDAPKHAIVAAAQALPKQPTAEQVEQALEAVKSKPHVANNSGDNEWYTPKEYIEAARQVLGHIDLDPASNPVANDVVRAATYYTAEDSGLDKDWQGTVWMNPPYESGLIGQFVEKLCDSYASGTVTNAVVLVNNATETKWFQSLAEQASAICFPRGRVRFWAPGKKQATPLQGQAVLYLGDDTEAFVSQFSSFGFCMEAAT